MQAPITFWDMVTRKLVKQLGDNQRGAGKIVLTSDGRTLISEEPRVNSF